MKLFIFNTLLATFLHICEQVFGLSQITYLLFRTSEHSPNGSCRSKCQSAAWDTFGASQPKGSPWQELSISSGEALPGFNERSRGRTSQSQKNLPAVCNRCYTFCHWVGESANLRWRKWQCPHQGGSLEHDMPSVWGFMPNPVSRATAASTSPRSAQAQVTTAGNASCPADKWYHFNYTNSSSRAAAEIILGSHGLRLKHHLITLMNCCLTLCLTLSSQRELPVQHLLSQRTHGRARSSHLLINCSSSCAPLMRAVSGACQPLAAHHCQASNVSHEPRALPASLGFWKQNLVPFYGTQCTKVT